MTDERTISGEFVCVVCPNGCAIDASFERVPSPKLISWNGEGCDCGSVWLRQEIESPMRTIATSVMVENGDFICASVRTKSPITLSKVGDVMRALKNITLAAPVHIGQVVLEDAAHTGSDVIATRDVRRRE